MCYKTNVAQLSELSLCPDLNKYKKEFDRATAIEIHRLIHLASHSQNAPADFTG